MGVIIPQVVTEDRAGGAQVIDGSLRFDSSKSQHLVRTPSSAGNRRTFTWSGWVKRNKLGTYQYLLSAYQSGSYRASLLFNNDETLNFALGNTSPTITTTAVFRDISSWYHIVVSIDTTQATQSNGMKLYVNGVLQVATNSGTYTQNDESWINTTNAHLFGYPGNYYLDTQLSNVYFIDGQALDPSYFGYTDPLTNTWRPKKLSSSVAFGTNGFYLPLDGNTPIGQDQSGRGNNWTPVNFGGSNTLEKATGALPILNTDGGGKVARVGVRTDSNASSLVLALPLVGIKSDFSNAINSGTTGKAVTNNSVTFSSSYSNFYGGSASFSNSSGSRLTIPDSADWNIGGTFTVEFWVYRTSASRGHIVGQYDYPNNSSGGWTVEIDGNGSAVGTNKLYFFAMDVGGNYQFYICDYAGYNQWDHIAVCRESNGTPRIYINGVSQTISNTSGGGSGNVGDYALSLAVGGEQDGAYALNGYIQDFRIYKGVAKYTQNFIPASTDPDILPDTPSGVAYSSNVALVPSTDGGSVGLGDGGSASRYLTLASSADFGFGTGDFTVECFVLETKKDYTNGGNPRVFDFGATFQMVLERPADSGSVRIDYGDSTLMYSNTQLSPNRWNHIALVRSGSTLSLYVNGVFDKSISNSTNVPTPSNTIYIGRYYGADSGWLNGFISNFHVVKGTALYTGTGTITIPTSPITSVANTKLLCCKSQTSATAFDVSPGTITATGSSGSPSASNFNPFSPPNINFVRGQESGYATMNPIGVLNTTTGTIPTLSNGNLYASASATWSYAYSTIAVPSTIGKYYCEFTVISLYASDYMAFGINPAAPGSLGATAHSSSNGGVWYTDDGTKFVGSTRTSYGSSYTNGDTIGIALNCDNQTVTFYKNNISQGSISFNSNLTSASNILIGIDIHTSSIAANFGQKPFKFPPPAGFQPLALANTPRPTIVRPDQYVGISTWTGDGNSTRSISNYSFKPDFIWIKNRDSSSNHALIDTVRGTGAKVLCSDQTYADNDYGLTVSSFDRTGFTVATGSINFSYANSSTNRYVGWAWKAGGNSNTYNINDIGYSIASAAGLTAGTITPSGASVNTKSGFSIITWTGNGVSSATIAHGLNASPAFIITVSRDGGSNWNVYHQSLATNNRLFFTTSAAVNVATSFGGGGIGPGTSSVINFTQGTSDVGNANANNVRYVAYVWAEIPGFSKFGSYVGGSNPFVYLGFRPRFILFKSTGSSNWDIYDSSRTPYNEVNLSLSPNLADFEYNAGVNGIDFLSNGFKCDGGQNTAATFVYAAFAEAPSFNLYGGQANAR